MQKKVPEQQPNLQKLMTQYEGLKAIGSVDTQNKLFDIANFIAENNKGLSTDGLDIEIKRLILLHRQLTLKDISNDHILSKIPLDQLNIKTLGDKVGESIVDQIVLTQFASLSDKITIFNSAAKNYKKELDKSLIYLLVMSHIADKGFYEHLEKLILKSDDIVYFPDKYSYNPYDGKQEILTEAVSHLLNIIINREAKRDGGIPYMKELIIKYSSIIKYQNICNLESKGVSHPIFYLVESRMWEELYTWIEQDQNILMMADSTGKNSLITTILTFAHGDIKKGKEHDALLGLQKFAIQQYISGDMYKMFAGEHKIIEPQIGLFIGYLEYDKANVSKVNESFIKTTRTYYKLLTEYFIKIDHDLKYNNFLKARVNGAILPEFQSSEMISLWSLILRSNSPFVVSQSQLDAIPQDELIVDLYKGVIVQNKVNERAEKILDEISKLFKNYTTDNISKDKNIILDTISTYSRQNNPKALDQLKIGKDNLISSMFNDYLKISYSDIFDYKTEVSHKLYNTVITGVNNETFNPINFIVENPDTFAMICTMGCERLLEAFEGRIELEKKLDKALEQNLEMDNFIGSTNIHSTKLLKILVPSAITAMWLGHKDNSTEDSYPSFLKVADILNTIIRRVGRYIGEPAILLNIEDNYLNEAKLSYISCKIKEETVTPNIQTISSLDLQFIDGKFQLIGHGLVVDYIRLYNFYSAFLAKKLYMGSSFEYDKLLNSSQPTEVKHIEDSNVIHQPYNLFNKATSVINTLKNAVIPYMGGSDIQYKLNEHNINKAINLSILYLNNRHNQFKIENFEQDKDLSQICNLFNIIDRKNPIFEDVNNAISDLWENIRMMGSERTKLLLEFFIEKKYLENDQHEIKCIITRCIKTALISKDLDGLKIWLDYSVDRLSSEKSTYNIIKKINVQDIKNQSQVMAIHDALNIAITLNIPQGVEVILKNYVNFLILYRHSEIFDKYTVLPFAIIREHSKSKMMEVIEFQDALSKITVMFLENGYPIDLIEKCDDLKDSSFIKSLISDQVKYSLKRIALNYSDTLPIPFINQFKEVGKVMLEVQYYLDIYEKSFNFLYGKSYENKIDINNFCHIFASVLQPKDFLSRLKNITFLTGIKSNFTVKDDDKQLIKQAKNVALIIKDMDDDIVKNFTISWHAFMKDEYMAFQDICNYIDKYVITKEENFLEDNNPQHEEINFFEYLYKKSQPRNPDVALHKMEQNNSMKILSQVGASLITGTFILFNNPDMRNTLITVIPTVYSGLTLAGSISSTIINTVLSTTQSLIGNIQDISYTALYLVLAGATIYAGYKLYQGINNEKVVKLNLKIFEDLVEKWQITQNKNGLKALTSRTAVHNRMSKLFKALTNNELMPCETFFSILKRFGMHSPELDHAIHNLGNNIQDSDLMDNILSIAYAMSFAAIYINIQKIKPIIDKVDESSKIKLCRLLHDVLTGNVTNIQLAMKDSGLEKFYVEDLSKRTNSGLQVISNYFDCKKTYQYLYLWDKTSNSNICEKAVQKLNLLPETIDNNPFIKFILVLKGQMNNKIQPNEVINNISLSSLSLD